MIQIKSDENKILYFDMAVEGIDQDQLSFMFRLNVNDVEYGFPCTIQNEKLVVSIPALENILQEGTSGIYRGKLEGIGENKYYVAPWEDSIEIKIEPKVIAKPEPIQEVVSVNPKVKAYLTSGPKVLVEEKKEKKPANKVNKALRDKMM